ncbi:MAG: 1-deoxy-D-xylulose-5-phosphate reductoisomerase [Candidatus Caenarcaniphilales bacterium]|nr:1-deoxy-D-xylulose-5-phosphate reductoisomerase [Candidatus Caenarcaniphilales bacterium]
MKSLSIIGSTGSIGTQLLNIVRERKEEFKVIALSARNSKDLLIEQIREFKPSYVFIENQEAQQEISAKFPEIELLKSTEEVAQIENIDIFFSAIVGIAGLKANLEALKTAKRVAIANKETLVVAGHLVEELCKKYNSELIPVDSEHVAIHQCLQTNSENKDLREAIKEILLTSSGGPFRTKSAEELKHVKLEDALKHPTWTMGRKITIDSSTLMNKALEVIEAHVLFKISYEKIQVVIHPQSIIHSAVSFTDGNIICQMGANNMEIPIQYALDFPERRPLATEDTFNIFDHRLEFYKPDLEKFPLLKLGYEVGKLANSYPCAFNAANEAAVELFLNKEIEWLDISKHIHEIIEKHKLIKNPSIEELLGIDKDVKETISSSLKIL